MGAGKGSDNPADAITKKYKKRIKRLCLCGIFWTFFAILALVIGIALLVHFAKYWVPATAPDAGDSSTESPIPEESTSVKLKRGLAYFGVAMLIIFLFSLAAGIILFIIMRRIYVHLEGGGPMKKMFKPQPYAYGEAPYPQQPPDAPPRTVGVDNSPSKEPLNPGAPQEPSAPPTGKLSDVNIEVSDHHKF